MCTTGTDFGGSTNVESTCPALVAEEIEFGTRRPLMTFQRVESKHIFFLIYVPN